MLASSNHSLAAADFIMFCKIIPVSGQYFDKKWWKKCRADWFGCSVGLQSATVRSPLCSPWHRLRELLWGFSGIRQRSLHCSSGGQPRSSRDNAYCAFSFSSGSSKGYSCWEHFSCLASVDARGCIHLPPSPDACGCAWGPALLSTGRMELSDLWHKQGVLESKPSAFIRVLLNWVETATWEYQLYQKLSQSNKTRVRHLYQSCAQSWGVQDDRRRGLWKALQYSVVGAPVQLQQPQPLVWHEK